MQRFLEEGLVLNDEGHFFRIWDWCEVDGSLMRIFSVTPDIVDGVTIWCQEFKPSTCGNNPAHIEGGDCVAGPPGPMQRLVRSKPQAGWCVTCEKIALFDIGLL